MTVDIPIDYTKLDQLINKDVLFLLFRDPIDRKITLALFSDQAVESLENLPQLDGKHGFVFAPFQSCVQHPILLLKAPTLYVGNEAIQAYLSTIDSLQEGQDRKNHQPIDMLIDQTETKKNYEQTFNAVHKAVLADACKKVVLSRKQIIPRSTAFSSGNLFNAACSTYRDAFVYLCHTPVTGTWLGSSPELLMAGKDRQWQTVALAGTQLPESTQPTMWDKKNQLEQQLVVDFIEQVLKSFGTHHEKKGPHSYKAGALTHLKTSISFDLNKPQTKHLGTLIDALHPTPATCGYPKKAALELIHTHEPYDRSYYCGFIGYLDVQHETLLYVNLRCMRITPTTLELFAGGGLLPDSDCEAEWNETESKLQTLLTLLDN